ncbi:ABC transporter permease [Deinococcus aquiradiocola]|uniref:Peptide ABC transporter permease n=1 Tax=Deinococcus aquiradiocola TaxID=393059 RepID=A0A917UNL0_9DEIO|nr:ABC transporter permease [Deinococcus aquiradiocola]GGJ70649.1 peptide ABC transporter permease [Deinococcus aquiradiocola]
MAYILRKFGILVFTLWVAATLNFILPRLVPGDPVGAMMARYQGQLTPDAAQALRIAYGLTDQGSALTQYFTYLNNMLHGNFGRSVSQFPSPVTDIIAQAAPWTIGLLGVTTVLSFLIGSALGLYSAWRRGTWLANILPPLALFVNAMPYFWFALLLIYFLALKRDVFPISGNLDPFVGDAFTPKWWTSMLRHAALPAITIVVTAAGGWLITMRNNVMSVLGEDYLAFARAKGLSERRIVNRYVLRNAMLPSLTAFGMALGFVVGGSILVETVFSYPGLGFYLFTSVNAKDYPLMQALFLMIAAAVLIANFLVDLLYAVLDPRVRDGRPA